MTTGRIHRSEQWRTQFHSPSEKLSMSTDTTTFFWKQPFSPKFVLTLTKVKAQQHREVLIVSQMCSSKGVETKTLWKDRWGSLGEKSLFSLWTAQMGRAVVRLQPSESKAKCRCDSSLLLWSVSCGLFAVRRWGQNMSGQPSQLPRSFASQ